MKIDTEYIFKRALERVQAELNSEILAVNTNKGDTLVLPDIAADAYFFASIPNAAFNYANFVVYGFLANPQVEAAQEDNNLKELNLYFEVVSVDAGENPAQNVIYKLMRYATALENLFLKSSDKIMQGYGKIQVTTLVPSGLFSLNGKMVRSAGVSVTARITAR